MNMKPLALSLALSGNFVSRQERHKFGYAPKPPSPVMPTWKPVLSQQEQAERERMIAERVVPF